MRYLCLVTMDPSITSKMTEADWKAFQQGTRTFDDELKADGRFVTASPLDQPETARTLRQRKAGVMVTDGPFAETKEYIAGFIIFEAADMKEAVGIASRSPFTRVGSIEVRALRQY
jgi:hypothetical protein